jgi:hypothetical protein
LSPASNARVAAPASNPVATPFLYGAGGTQTAASLACGALLIALSLRRGPIRGRYGSWDRFVV